MCSVGVRGIEDCMSYCAILTLHYPSPEQVISVNFHPFYRNTEIVRKDKFQVNVTMITVHDEVLSQAAANINLVRLL